MKMQRKALALAALAGSALCSAAHAQVVNGNFETGTFAPWTQFGDTGFTGVGTGVVHGGTYAGFFGPTGATGGIQQTLTANAGDNLVVDFWYQAQGSNNSFSVAVGGNTLLSLTNDTAHTAWTHYTLGVVAPSANPALAFTFFNPPSYDYLDDVSQFTGVLSACCLTDGSCSLTDANGCTALGGTFHSGQTCAQAGCPQPATGACCKTDGTCASLTQAQCGAISGAVYHGDNVLCANANCPQPPTGACCISATGCSLLSQVACTAAGGTYGGDNSACTQAFCPTGACCMQDGTCQAATSSGCSTAVGIYYGDGSSCANAACATGACCQVDGTCTQDNRAHCVMNGGAYQGSGSQCGTCPLPFPEPASDAGELPATAAVPGGSGPLTFITGSIGNGNDADMYLINICDRTKFSATTVGNGNTMDTQIFLFDTTGHPIVMDDDWPGHIASGSVITGQYVPSNGSYLLAISNYNKDPIDGTTATTNLLWANTNPNTNTYFPEWPPLAGAAPVAGWLQTTTVTGTYTIALSGTCYPGASCYANCDNSTANPILNANDFQCFLNAYAADSTLPNAQQITAYSNCDHSTGNPALNANDFQCFLNAYAAGCT